MLKINQIYKVKEGHEGKCGVYNNNNGKYILITKKQNNQDDFYKVLGDDKEFIGWQCAMCFTEDDLEEEEVKNELPNMLEIQQGQNRVRREVKEKSLEDLEVGDMFISPYGEKHKVSGIDDIVFKVDDFETVVFTLNYLKKEGYKFYNPNEIKSLSPSEAETLLEEKLGYKVKIK